MPFCPRCKFEYKVDTVRCPDCDVELVAELAAPEVELGNSDGTLEEAGWTAIGILTSTLYAEQLVEGLRNSGIAAEVVSGAGYFGATGMMGDGSYAGGGGGYAILVETGRAAEADEIAEVILGDIWMNSRIVEFEDDSETT